MKPYFLLPVLLANLSFASADQFSEAETVGTTHGETALEASTSAIEVNDLRNYVTKLTSEEFGGRGTGDPGERMATAYFAAFLKGLGLKPVGDDSTFFQNFEFNAGMQLKGTNSLSIKNGDTVRECKTGVDYQPLPFSLPGKLDADVVFGGFGIQHKGYNSYESLELKDKWVILLRGIPKDRDNLKPYETLVAKAQIAKKKGAVGVIFVKAGNSKVGPEIVPITMEMGKEIFPAITISDVLAASLLGSESSDLTALFDSYSTGKKTHGYDLSFRITSEINLAPVMDPGRNVLGCLVVGNEPSEQVIVLGAHIDHVGFGNRGGSMAKGEEAKKLHPGADDNASGVALLMEMAQYFADQKRAGTLKLNRDIVFAGWSGEEMGLYGSQHYVKLARKLNDKVIYPKIAAYVNFDMVGRASKDGLFLNGTASSKAWSEILDSIKDIPGLKIKRSNSPYFASDASAFYSAGVPVLGAFTGEHKDYHTPRDTVDKINFKGLAKISEFTKNLVESLGTRSEAPDYVEVPRPKNTPAKVKIGIHMEVADGIGIRVKEVAKDSAGQRAGILVDDILTSLNGVTIKTLDEIFETLRKLQPNQKYPVTIQRNGKIINLEIVPEGR